jgi:hypothetical protein
MDGKSFDRLSVGVHRLREQASRRGAFRLLLGGSLAAVGVGVAAEADAKHKNKNKHKNKKHKNKNRYNKNCRGYGTTCRSHNDCCNGSCRNGFCFYNGGGGGGGGNCGNQYCPNGWRCRNQGGVQVCVPDNFDNYCGNNNWYGPNYNCCNGFYGGACLTGGECCGGAGMCCQSGWRCCGGGICIPQGWDCNDFYLQSAGGDVGVESTDPIPSMAPTPVDADAYYTSAPVE